ncbi:hypothetical protein Rsub_02828 [Raphidocelis subcapitata]|uniref:EH domain-containing protein n=1 Tax=Raphidocelis subcapitata TaxID=307507 RepID=A0A2V0NPU5_9CHLO|nr:hypothetical protein Rsub_02828 [Raphidocelis subcapitata]|eukprot:GBF89658.1 hypothetical protein Rsub_02828 [Raphidocelis subcapitata]
MTGGTMMAAGMEALSIAEDMHNRGDQAAVPAPLSPAKAAPRVAQPVPKAVTYDEWFRFADSDADGRLTGADAVTLFKRSGLSKDLLARVWDLSNTTRSGFLDRAAFHKAMDLISIAQQGGEVSREAYLAASSRGVPPPSMAGLDAESGAAAAAAAATTAQQQGAPGRDAAARAQGDRLPGRLRTFGRQRAQGPARAVTSVIDGIKRIYLEKVRPLEEAFRFEAFYSAPMAEGDFDARPSVLLIGQYSTGKTTFCRSLLGRDYPGAHIGPEPTTDKFVVVHHGLEDRRTPGNTLAVQADKPYQGLSAFGTGFLSRFEGSQMPCPLLESVTLIDTPGVLSGEKQRADRNYSYIDAISWFANRCDMVLLLFDCFKLDISDEMRAVIRALKGHDDKIRVVLNKADQIDQQQLMRVYGALMWSLGKVVASPEVSRVYVGSFNGEPPGHGATGRNPECAALFAREHAALIDDLHEIPTRACDRKVNEFVKRVRALRTHMLLLGAVRRQLPLFGKDKAQRKLLDNLPAVFAEVQREHRVPPNDFPDLQAFRDILASFDCSAFPKLSDAKLAAVESVLRDDVPGLMRAFANPIA